MWWILLSTFALALGFVIAHLRRASAKPRGPKLFAREVAGDSSAAAGLWRKINERQDVINTATSSPTPSVSEMEGLVDTLQNGEEPLRIAAGIRLAKAGDAAAPVLLRALDNPAAAWDRSEGSSRTSARAGVVFEFLWPLRPRELAERIGNVCDNPQSLIGIKARAAIGRADLLPWLVSLLTDTEHRDAIGRREAACEGIEAAVRGGWVDPALFAAILEWAREHILAAAGHPIRWAFAFFARYRREEAVRLFTSGDLLSVHNNRSISFVIDELTRGGVSLPVTRLRPIVEKSLTAEAWPWKYTFGSAVTALGRVDLEDAIRIAESVSGHETHGFAAREFLFAARGLPKPCNAQPPEGFVLTSEERRVVEHLSNVVEASGQIGSGGLSQYFLNPSGDNWRRDITSFTAIGYSEGTEALERAAFVVDPRNGASLERGVRIRQYAELPNETEAELDRLGDVLCCERLDAAEYRFMVRHAELFRRLRAARLAAGTDSLGED